MIDGEQQPPSSPLPEEEHFEIVLAFDKSDRKLFEREYASRRAGWRGVFVFLTVFVITGVVAIVFGPMLGRSIGIDRPGIVSIVVFGCALIAFAYASRDTGVRLGWRAAPIDTEGWVPGHGR